MSSEIEAFLRKLAEQKLGTPLSSEDDDEIIDAEIIEDSEPLVAETSPQDRGPVGESRLGQRGTRLSASVDEADDRMDERLHEVFDHRLGQLGSQAEPESAVRKKVRSGYAKLLHSRKSIREAIILSEIINRPEHRW